MKMENIPADIKSKSLKEAREEIKEILSLNNFKIIDIYKKLSKSYTGEKIDIMNIFSQKIY